MAGNPISLTGHPAVMMHDGEQLIGFFFFERVPSTCQSLQQSSSGLRIVNLKAWDVGRLIKARLKQL